MFTVQILNIYYIGRAFLLPDIGPGDNRLLMFATEETMCVCEVKTVIGMRMARSKLRRCFLRKCILFMNIKIIM